LEHIEDDHAALLNIARLLTPDGRIIISVPAHGWLFGRRDVAYGHFRRYSTAMLTRLTDGAGLEIERIRHWNLLGVPFYFFYEKVLRRPINDNLRRNEGSIVSRVLRQILYLWLLAETHIPLPVGLSLLAVAKRKDAQPQP
jgi:SAM-dependent methyltransferase